VGKFTASSILEHQRKNISALHLMVDAEQGYGPDLQKVLDQISHDLGSHDYDQMKAIVIDRLVQGDQTEAYCPLVRSVPTLSKYEDLLWDLTVAVKTQGKSGYFFDPMYVSKFEEPSRCPVLKVDHRGTYSNRYDDSTTDLRWSFTKIDTVSAGEYKFDGVTKLPGEAIENFRVDGVPHAVEAHLPKTQDTRCDLTVFCAKPGKDMGYFYRDGVALQVIVRCNQRMWTGIFAQNGDYSMDTADDQLVAYPGVKSN